MSHKKFHYHLYGCKVESVIEIEGLPSSSPSPPDITIELAEVPFFIPRDSSQQSAWQAWPSRFYLDIRSVARYLVENGNKIFIAPYKESNRLELSVYLLGSAFGALLWQRGLFPLHASAVTNGKISFAITGDQGSGKSTSVSSFLKKGFIFVADDICAFTFQPDNLCTIQPGPPILKLLQDAALRYQLNLDENRFDLFDNKYRFKITKFVSIPTRCASLILLKDSKKTASVRQLHGAAKITALHDASYRQILIDGLGLRAQHFNYCTLLAKRLTIWEIVRNKQSTSIDAMSETIEQCLINTPDSV